MNHLKEYSSKSLTENKELITLVETIERLGGTTPEYLPTPKKLVSEIEREES